MRRFFRPREVPLLGIKVSSSTISMLVLTRESSVYCIEAFALEEDLSSKEMVSVLKRFANLIKVKYKNVAISMASSSVITRTISVDNEYDEKAIIEQIEVESDRFLPYPLEEVYYDFDIIGLSEKSNNLNDVLLVASQFQNIDTQLTLFSKASLNVNIVDVDFLAIERMFPFLIKNIPKENNATFVALFNLSISSTTVYIYKNKRIVYTKEHAADVSSENYKSFIEEETERMLQAFYSAVVESKEKPDGIILAGKRALLSSLECAAIQDKIGIKTYIINPFCDFNFSEAVDKEAINAAASSLFISFGLALRIFDESGQSKINLLPWREEARQTKNISFYGMVGLAVLFCIFIISLIHFFIQNKISQEHVNIDYLNNELQQMKEQVREIQDLQKNKIEILSRLELIKTLQDDRTSIVKLLDKVVHLIPEGIYLTAFSRKCAVVTLQGNAQTNASISLFLKNLEQDPWFNNERLEKVMLNKKGFGLTFKLQFNHVVLEAKE